MKLAIICTICLISIAIASVTEDETEKSPELALKETERGGGGCIKKGDKCDPKNDKCCKDHKCACDSGKKKKKDKKDKKDKKNNVNDDESDTDSEIPLKWNCFCDVKIKG